MKTQGTVFSQKNDLIFKEDHPMVMGILNVTNDSFFDGGNYFSEGDWLIQAKKMVDQGADIIDIGACSTRPGTIGVSEEVEIKQLLPAIKSVRKHFPELLISADTFRSAVAEKAVKAGANIINDISGGTMDVSMFDTISKLQVPYILMHIQGTPQNMQNNPNYENVTEEIFTFFRKKINELQKLGFNKIILDPGFGFGKTLEHNYQLLKDLEKFHTFDFPILVGFSRKSMITKLLNIKTKDALNGTSILNTIALGKGAKILRVHDVKAAKEGVEIVSYLKGM